MLDPTVSRPISSSPSLLHIPFILAIDPYKSFKELEGETKVSGECGDLQKIDQVMDSWYAHDYFRLYAKVIRYFPRGISRSPLPLKKWTITCCANYYRNPSWKK